MQNPSRGDATGDSSIPGDGSAPGDGVIPGEGVIPGDEAIARSEVNPHVGAIPAVALISASWAGPSRPAPTVLRELARRWGPAVHTLLIEDPSEEDLEQWGVEVLPTWVRLLPADAAAGPTGSGVEDALSFSNCSGLGPHGERVLLPGLWRVVHRRTGAQPKHVIEEEFGPSA